MKSAAQPTAPHIEPAQQEHRSRMLAYVALAATIAAGVFTAHFTYAILWMVPYALTYPLLAQAVGRRLHMDHPRRTRIGLLLVDALHAGLAASLLSFPLVPSLMLVLMLAFSVLIVEGVRTLAQVLGTMLVAAAAGALLHMQPPVLDTPALVSVVSIFFAFIYICTAAFFVHEQGIRLDLAREQLKREQEKAAKQARSLAKYLSPQVWESIFSGKKAARLETQRKKLTVFFSDIKGFTEISEELEAEALTDMLNHYLNEMSKIALKYGGTIDKYIGDAVMIFFGDPTTQGAKKDAVAAVSMAIAMRKHMKVLRQYWRSQGIDKPLEIRMGINTGYCTVGNFGAETRMDYTIIGREVNLASRLESNADAGEILISHETYSLIKDVILCRDKGQIQVKGFSRPVQTYQVVDFRRDLGAASSFVEHELQGFSMYLDLNSVQNYDKERVLLALRQAEAKLRDKTII